MTFGPTDFFSAFVVSLVRANMAADEKEKLPEAEILGQMK